MDSLLEKLQDPAQTSEATIQIFECYSAYVLGVAREFVAESAACEAVLSEVFIRLSKQKMSLPQTTVLKTWLCLTTRNVATEYKKKNKKGVILTTVSKNVEPPTLSPQTVHNVECRTVLNILEIMEQSSQHKILQDFYIRGKTAEQLCEETSQDLQTFRKNLLQLRQECKSLIAKEIDKIGREAS